MPKRWELDIQPGPLRTAVINTDTGPRAYFFLTYKVTNNGTGDLLFARASAIVAELGPEAVSVQARTFERLVTGQTRETVGPAEGEDPVEHYLAVLADKTGALIATSGRFGAEFAGCPTDVVDVLVDYGERIGVAFQLADDLIDLSSETGQSGKTPGTDLREGIATLPVLYLYLPPIVLTLSPVPLLATFSGHSCVTVG